MTQPVGTPQGPWHPTATPDLGLDFDRADIDDTTTTVPDGVEVIPLPGRYTVQLKDCCGVLVGEYCDCAEFAAGLGLAPVIVWPAYDVRQLREQHVTADQVFRAEHGREVA